MPLNLFLSSLSFAYAGHRGGHLFANVSMSTDKSLELNGLMSGNVRRAVANSDSAMPLLVTIGASSRGLSFQSGLVVIQCELWWNRNTKEAWVRSGRRCHDKAQSSSRLPWIAPSFIPYVRSGNHRLMLYYTSFTRMIPKTTKALLGGDTLRLEDIRTIPALTIADDCPRVYVCVVT
jgi:hypothetical protein